MAHEIANLDFGRKVETWTEGSHQVLLVSDGTHTITVNLPDFHAGRLAWAMTPAMGEHFDRARQAGHALWALNYPAARADALRAVANQLGDPGCDDPCTDRDFARGEFCRCYEAEQLRELADALDLKAKVEKERELVVRGWRILAYRALYRFSPRLAVRCLHPDDIKF